MQDQIKQSMRSLKMTGMADLYQSLGETHQLKHLSGDQLLQTLLQAEWEYRQNRKQVRLVNTARFRYQASLEEIDYTTSRNLDHLVLARLSDCTFFEKAENILITGPTGVGKSFIASAIGHQACRKGYKVLYFNMQKLVQRLKVAKVGGTFIKELSRIEKQDLLILDDFGIHPMDAIFRLELLEIIEDRHGKKSTLIGSQLPVSKWHDMIDEPTVADAILDRMLHNAIRIDLKGESLRKKQ